MRRQRATDAGGGAFGSYLLAQVPGWAVAALIAWALLRWGAVSVPFALALVGAWVLKDLVLFPFVRRFYQPQPSQQRIVDKTGIAVTSVANEGVVRIHGELWQARADRRISQGEAVRVREIDGLTLVVTAVKENENGRP